MTGTCTEKIPRWTYLNKWGCVLYSGCKGNQNNFMTMKACMDACGKRGVIDEKREYRKRKKCCKKKKGKKCRKGKKCQKGKKCPNGKKVRKGKKCRKGKEEIILGNEESEGSLKSADFHEIFHRRGE